MAHPNPWRRPGRGRTRMIVEVTAFQRVCRNRQAVPDPARMLRRQLHAHAMVRERWIVGCATGLGDGRRADDRTRRRASLRLPCLQRTHRHPTGRGLTFNVKEQKTMDFRGHGLCDGARRLAARRQPGDTVCRRHTLRLRAGQEIVERDTEAVERPRHQIVLATVNTTSRAARSSRFDRSPTSHPDTTGVLVEIVGHRLQQRPLRFAQPAASAFLDAGDVGVVSGHASRPWRRRRCAWRSPVPGRTRTRPGQPTDAQDQELAVAKRQGLFAEDVGWRTASSASPIAGDGPAPPKMLKIWPFIAFFLTFWRSSAAGRKIAHGNALRA